MLETLGWNSKLVYVNFGQCFDILGQIATAVAIDNELGIELNISLKL